LRLCASNIKKEKVDRSATGVKKLKPQVSKETYLQINAVCAKFF